MTLSDKQAKKMYLEKDNLVSIDLSNIKKELFTNPKLYIHDLLKSLKAKGRHPFSAYKIDISLIYLKRLYEKIFPQRKHGGHLTSRNREIDLNKSRGETHNVKLSFTLTKDILLPEKAIIQNLFEEVQFRDHIPSFVELIAKSVSLSKTAIQNRIRVGNYAICDDRIEDLLLLYRNKEVSRTKVLKEMRKINKVPQYS